MFIAVCLTSTPSVRRLTTMPSIRGPARQSCLSEVREKVKMKSTNIHRQTDEWTNRQTDRQKDRQTERQTDRKTDGLTDLLEEVVLVAI